MTDDYSFLGRRKPDFENLLTVLAGGKPARPTLFELFLNDSLCCKLAGEAIAGQTDSLSMPRTWIHGFKNAGYDYATIPTWHLGIVLFPVEEAEKKQTISLNAGHAISDWSSFESYPWIDPASLDYSALTKLKPDLPDGMKLIVTGPGGVLENAISLAGFETLCLLLTDDPALVQAIFDAIGSRLVEYYRRCSVFESVGAVISNDDWGFKTQTMFKTADMKKYVFPWHQKIVETIHAAGKPAILHSCGYFSNIMDFIIDDLKYDARHSYEDNILPVEEAYERFGRRIAILGGIDIDFMVRSTPDEIYRRSQAMLERSATKGAYALGTGNSVPEYIPEENYFAMLRAALEFRF
jgi:uroporphyrinogen decarboxylase